MLRELSFYGSKSKIKKLYQDLFHADHSDDESSSTSPSPQKPPPPSPLHNKKRLFT